MGSHRGVVACSAVQCRLSRPPMEGPPMNCGSCLVFQQLGRVNRHSGGGTAPLPGGRRSTIVYAGLSVCVKTCASACVRERELHKNAHSFSSSQTKQPVLIIASYSSRCQLGRKHMPGILRAVSCISCLRRKPCDVTATSRLSSLSVAM